VRHGFLGNTTTDLAGLLGRPLADPLAVAAARIADAVSAAP
jgi:hypothetical protein